MQAETARIFSILYGGRLESPSTQRALELVRAGAIGDVLQTVGLGPHRLNAPSRPDWFWDRQRFGGVLCDLATHQTDDFLTFTGATRAEVVAAQADNLRHPQHPAFEDFGDAMVRSNRRQRVLPRRLVLARRAAGLRRLAPDRHRLGRLPRTAQDHRHRRPPEGQSPAPGRRDGHPLHRQRAHPIALRSAPRSPTCATAPRRR